MANRFFIVDVFAESAYTGNQLAVVVCEVPLPDATMQQIAAETNYSETTFVTPEPEQNGGYRVRILPPRVKLPLPVIPSSVARGSCVIMSCHEPPHRFG